METIAKFYTEVKRHGESLGTSRSWLFQVPVLFMLLVFAGCQTTPLPAPRPGGIVRTGQMLYSGPKRSIVGEFSMRTAPGDFQLEVSKSSVSLLTIRELDGNVARFEGGGHTWQGDPKRAPKQLRSWFVLDDVFSGKPDDSSRQVKKNGPQTAIDFPATGERFIFHFNGSAQ